MAVRTVLRAAVLAASRRSPPFRGKLRVTRRLFDLLSPKTRRLRVEQGGALFEVVGEDWIEFSLVYGEPLSNDVVGILERYARRGASPLWDIGANVGTVSLPLAASCRDLQILAFEPSPPVLALLVRNRDLNPQLADRIEILGTALSDQSASVPFFISNESFNSGVGGLGRSHNRSARSFRIWASRGDDLVEQGMALSPQLVKIDVEGFELEVVRGMRATLRASRRVAIVFEHKLSRLAERSQEKDVVVNELVELGFSVSVIEAGAVARPLVPGDLDTDHDFLAEKGWEIPGDG